MGFRLEQTLRRWAAGLGLEAGRLPSRSALRELIIGGLDPVRPPANPEAVEAWEARHGYPLPRGLRAWLQLSDGLHTEVALVHPLSGIGPMVPFARVPDLLIQPESWFELGNPESETICVDLAYRWPGPGGDYPVFASGDDERGVAPRIVAESFEAWFLRLLSEGGRPYWQEPGFVPLGDPWVEHRRFTPPPELPARLRPLAPAVAARIGTGGDERSIATDLGVSRLDVELIVRSVQHTQPEPARPA